MTNSYDSFNSSARSPVRVVQVPSFGVSRRSPVKPGASATRWIVRSVMVATTAFALLDLILLVSGGHH